MEFLKLLKLTAKDTKSAKVLLRFNVFISMFYRTRSVFLTISESISFLLSLRGTKQSPTCLEIASLHSQ